MPRLAAILSEGSQARLPRQLNGRFNEWLDVNIPVVGPCGARPMGPHGARSQPRPLGGATVRTALSVGRGARKWVRATRHLC